MANEDYYNLLGIDRQAPEREIKRAYYSLARELHPDKANDPEEARANAEKLAVISKAYNTLKDPKKREEYDGKLKARPAASPKTQTKTPEAKSQPPDKQEASKRQNPPPAATEAKKEAPRQQAPAAGGGAPNLSSSDIASQRVLTAQKAFVKGMEYYKVQDFKKALPFFEAAVKNDPESEPQYHMKMAICLMRSKGSFNRAVEAAQKAGDLDPYNVEYKLGLGEIYEIAGAATKAKSVYEDVLRWEADNERALFRLRMLAQETSQGSSIQQLLAKLLPSIFDKK